LDAVIAPCLKPYPPKWLYDCVALPPPPPPPTAVRTPATTVIVDPLLAVGTLVGCSTTATKSPEVSDSIRKSLDQANLKDVSVSQDRDKGVVTLGGHVAAEGDKSQAESIAKLIASGQVVSNQIAVIPPSAENDAKAVNSDLDKGVEKNLDAALIRRRLQSPQSEFFPVVLGGGHHQRIVTGLEC